MKFLRDKKGNSIVWKEKKENAATVFECAIVEILFGFWGGTLGSKYRKTKRFVRKIKGQGYDLNDCEMFLRFICSAIEMLEEQAEVDMNKT